MVECYAPLCDSRWKVIEEFLPMQRKRKLNLREIMDAVFFICRTGVQWRNLPPNFPDWRSVYYYFSKWKADGTFDTVGRALNSRDRLQEKRDALPSALCIDSQSVRLAPMMGSERGLDANKKVNGRKRHIATDTGGRVWAVFVRAADTSDSVVGCTVLEKLAGYSDRLRKLFVDGGYQKRFIESAAALGIDAEVVSRPETAKGFVPLKHRWVVERTLAWFNFFRRITKDYERTVQSSEAFIVIANISMMLQRISP